LPKQGEVFELIDIAIRSGALMQLPSSIRYPNDIRSVVVYGLTESSEYVQKLHETVIADSKQRAQKIASAAGKQIGEILKIEYPKYSPWNMPRHIYGRIADFPTEYIGSDQDEIYLDHEVSVTFALLSE